MNDLEKINADFARLFQDGQEQLKAGCGMGMNAVRDSAFGQFMEMGGIPEKKEEYIYAKLLPVFGRDYHVMLKYLRQDVDLNEVFRCSVTDLVTDPILTVNGWWFDGNLAPGLPEEVVVCSLREASLKYPDLFLKYYNRNALGARKDGLVLLNTAFAQDGVFIYVPDDVVLERPLQIINLLRARADLMGFQRNLNQDILTQFIQYGLFDTAADAQTDFGKFDDQIHGGYLQQMGDDDLLFIEIGINIMAGHIFLIQKHEGTLAEIISQSAFSDFQIFQV